jgi:hypothetical protein
MPSSAVRTFTDHDEYFAVIQNLQLEGLVARRSQLRAEAMYIDVHRLWMHRFNEDLLRIMKSYGRNVPGVPRENCEAGRGGALTAPVDDVLGYVFPAPDGRGGSGGRENHPKGGPR